MMLQEESYNLCKHYNVSPYNYGQKNAWGIKFLCFAYIRVHKLCGFAVTGHNSRAICNITKHFEFLLRFDHFIVYYTCPNLTYGLVVCIITAIRSSITTVYYCDQMDVL